MTNWEALTKRSGQMLMGQVVPGSHGRQVRNDMFFCISSTSVWRLSSHTHRHAAAQQRRQLNDFRLVRSMEQHCSIKDSICCQSLLDYPYSEIEFSLLGETSLACSWYFCSVMFVVCVSCYLAWFLLCSHNVCSQDACGLPLPRREGRMHMLSQTLLYPDFKFTMILEPT